MAREAAKQSFMSTPAPCMAVSVGTAIPLLVNNVSRLLGIWNEGIWVLVIGGIIFSASGFVMAYKQPQYATSRGLAIYFSMPAGVFIDVVLDWTIRSYDRNLWPLEIVMWGVIAPVPLYIGVVIGRKLGEARRIQGEVQGGER